jgi:hypothetical protein
MEMVSGGDKSLLVRRQGGRPNLGRLRFSSATPLPPVATPLPMIGDCR